MPTKYCLTVADNHAILKLKQEANLLPDECGECVEITSDSDVCRGAK